MFIFFFTFLGFCVSELYSVLWSGIYPWNALAYASEAHIYQTYRQLVEYGVNPDKIITFGMDNAAYNKENPKQGDVHSYVDGPNVYEGFKYDYVMKNNTPDVLMDVLTGKETGVGSGRVLNTTEEDDIFIVSFQHGAPGCLIFYYNDDLSDYKVLLDTDLIRTLKEMKEKKMFRNIVFYTTACHSGSMFYKIPEEIGGWYAMTSAPPKKEALACDPCEEYPHTYYLNSCFGRAWQNYTRICHDEGTLWEKTIYDQYMWTYDRRITTRYPYEEYCEYGDLTLRDKFIGVFQSKKSSNENFQKTDESVERDFSYSDKKETLLSGATKIFGNKKLKKVKERFEKKDEENYDPDVCNEAPFIHTLEYLEIIKGNTINSCYSKLIEVFQNKCGKLELLDFSNSLIFEEICKDGLVEQLKSYLNEIC